MKCFPQSIYTLVFFLFPLLVFADEGHSADEAHNEAAAIDPIVAILGVGGVVVVGFLLWFFILRKKSI